LLTFPLGFVSSLWYSVYGEVFFPWPNSCEFILLRPKCYSTFDFALGSCLFLGL
jgi:hypothetical protein